MRIFRIFVLKLRGLPSKIEMQKWRNYAPPCRRRICVRGSCAAKWADFVRGRHQSENRSSRRGGARYSRQRRSARIHQREHIGWNEGFIPGAANQVPLAYWLEKEKVAWFVTAAAAFTYHNYNIYYFQAAAAARTTCNYAALVPPTAQKTP